MKRLFYILYQAVIWLFNYLLGPILVYVVKKIIRFASNFKIAVFFVKELFSYDIENREKASTQLLMSVALIFFVTVIWSYFAEFDQVISANAKVYPFSRLQSVEHYEGGRIEKILVKSGDRVKAGDLLVTLSPIQTKGDFNIQRDNFTTLTIKQARLQAEYDDESSFQINKKLKATSGLVYEQELSLFYDRTNQHKFEIQSRKSEIESARARQSAATIGQTSSAEELETMRQLVARGLEPRLSLLRAEKSFADANSQLAVSNQDVLRSQAALESTIKERKAAILNELSKIRSDLTSSKENVLLAADRSDRSELRSPLEGTVNRVLVSTEGGTVKPGEPVVEIVPDGSTIVVEASIQPSDIGFIKVGQPTLVKITAYDFSIFGALDGVVTVVAADSITDEKGNQFYLVKIDLPENYIKSKHQNLKIIPGMVAQVDVVVGKRTALQYVFSPLTKVFQESFREK
jgi:adhesin transport system membrane fusion protein